MKALERPPHLKLIWLFKTHTTKLLQSLGTSESIYTFPLNNYGYENMQNEWNGAMVNVEMVEWWYKIWKKIRTNWTYSYSPYKGKQCDNNPYHYLWWSCEHLHIPLVLYPSFPMGYSFLKLPLQLIMLWTTLLYFALYPLLIPFPFALRTLFYLWLLPQFSCYCHRELWKHLLKEKLRMGNSEMVSMNQTIYLNPHGEMKKKW